VADHRAGRFERRRGRAHADARSLPADLPAAVLALLHSSPDRESVLPAILGRATALEVRAAQEGERVRPGLVLVAPAGYHTLVTPALEIALVKSGAYPPSRPSADLLLTTLAIAAGKRLIAGTVLASDAASSEHFAMPSETIHRDHIIDHVVALDALAPLLAQLVTAPTVE
jgi:two-component system chemotaxis response regulator CheB